MVAKLRDRFSSSDSTLRAINVSLKRSTPYITEEYSSIISEDYNIDSTDITNISEFEVELLYEKSNAEKGQKETWTEESSIYAYKYKGLWYIYLRY